MIIIFISVVISDGFNWFKVYYYAWLDSVPLLLSWIVFSSLCVLRTQLFSEDSSPSRLSNEAGRSKHPHRLQIVTQTNQKHGKARWQDSSKKNHTLAISQVQRFMDRRPNSEFKSLSVTHREWRESQWRNWEMNSGPRGKKNQPHEWEIQAINGNFVENKWWC